MHVKGALLYNHLIKKHKLEHKYPLIQEGDKIRFLNMKQPNIYQASAFSFITSFPIGLALMEKIDLDAQFERSFVAPIRFITDKMNWLIDDSSQGSLEEFFN
jgi:hypothetical protein